MGGRSALGAALAILAFPLAGAAQAQDREALERRLGNQAVVDYDARSGTPRVLARLDGTLTPASKRAPEAIARDYVRANLPDLDALSAPSVSSAGGVTTVLWRQSVDGVPASDRSLRVNLSADGRVLNVLGAPAQSLDVGTTPALTAGEAVRAVQDDVGVHRPLVRRGGTARRVSYGDDTSARLVTFSGRLAWRVQYRAGDDAVYDATVDARSGAVLRRANMVKSEAPALVWERFPGSGPGGAAVAVDLEARGYLPAGASTLAGPYVRAYSDLDDDDVAGAGEEVGPGFTFPLVPGSGNGCDAGHVCSWTGSGSTWAANREQDTVQAFYLANRFRDHLATLGFDGFEGADRVVVNTLDGAASGPDGDHVNNANMFTPPDGESPLMQMYLWRSPYRNVSSGSDAATLYHEYAHGLSNRLVVDADGVGALNTPQAGAMGEGWSDWYAQDFLVGQFGDLDTGAAGEVDMGAYVDAGASRIRSSPLDCPVGASSVACPGRGAAGSGGYTYGDFGRIFGSAEVHYDGEIWAQTLWDVRTALGFAKTRALVTAGMRLLPPEPSFLDARNGILLADQALYAGADAATLWEVFAARGMGFFAASIGGEDTAPAEDFSLPPGPEAPKGTISGRVTAVLGGGPVAGVTIGLGGVTGLAATTDADGRFTLGGVPEGTYPKVSAGGAGWDAEVSSLAVTGGATITFNPVLRRNWASSRGGATVTDSNGREFTSNGCGPSAALDQSLGTTWSTRAVGEKYLTLRLPETIDVTQFALDPAEGCGDTAASATGAYLIETSVDGEAWATAHQGVFTSAARHQLNFVTPSGGASGVRFVRLSLLSSQGFGAPFRDLSEFGVYGTTAGADTTEPETTLAAGGPPFSFSSNEAGTFECKVDAAEFAACTSPFTPEVADGEHTFSVRAVDAAGNRDASPETRTFTVDSTAPETGFVGAHPALTNNTTPTFTFASSPPGATFECSLDEAAFAACTSPYTTVVLADGRYTFAVRAIGGRPDPTPAVLTFRIDATAPETTIVSGPSGPVHSGPVAFGVGANEDATFECALDDGDFGPCSAVYRAEDLALGEHVYRARATDAAGNVDATPAERVFVVVNAAPVATLVFDPELGPAPHTPNVTIGATDADGDRLSYELDFGDGQQATGKLPAAAITHRYEAPGTYTVRLTVRDGRTSAATEGTVKVTTPLPAPGLSLRLSATAVALGTFVPGLAREYAGTLTATTTGNGTLTVSDRGTSPGYLLSGTTALARPLRVKATNGAFTPLTSAVTIPNSVEFRQSIAAADVLRPGAYVKALTFTLSPTTP